MANSNGKLAHENRKTLTVAMDDYDVACKLIASYEALQSLRLLIQYEINADATDLSLSQILSSLEVVEYAMRRVVEEF